MFFYCYAKASSLQNEIFLKIPFPRPCPTHLYLKSYISKLWMWRMLLWCFLLCIQFLFSLTKTCLPTPRIPHLHQWQQCSSNFPSQKLGNYSGLRISSSCHFKSIHEIYWFHFHGLSCILLLLSLSTATNLATTSCLVCHHHRLTMQESPGFCYFPSPTRSMAAAKMRVFNTKLDYVSFLLWGLYALLLLKWFLHSSRG